MNAFDYIWVNPFWRGYLCGAMLVLIIVTPVLFLNAWEVRYLRKELSQQQEPKPCP